MAGGAEPPTARQPFWPNSVRSRRSGGRASRESAAFPAHAAALRLCPIGRGPFDHQSGSLKHGALDVGTAIPLPAYGGHSGPVRRVGSSASVTVSGSLRGPLPVSSPEQPLGRQSNWEGDALLSAQIPGFTGQSGLRDTPPSWMPPACFEATTPPAPGAPGGY